MLIGKHMDDAQEGKKAVALGNEEANDSEESNMYARMKHQPRLHLKSAAIRTPFVIYQRRKFRK